MASCPLRTRLAHCEDSFSMEDKRKSEQWKIGSKLAVDVKQLAVQLYEEKQSHLFLKQHDPSPPKHRHLSEYYWLYLNK